VCHLLAPNEYQCENTISNERKDRVVNVKGILIDKENPAAPKKHKHREEGHNVERNGKAQNIRGYG
jgi:hypothetical protein